MKIGDSAVLPGVAHIACSGSCGVVQLAGYGIIVVGFKGASVPLAPAPTIVDEW